MLYDVTCAACGHVNERVDEDRRCAACGHGVYAMVHTVEEYASAERRRIASALERLHDLLDARFPGRE